MRKPIKKWCADRMVTLIVFVKKRLDPKGGGELGYSFKIGCHLTIKKRKDCQAGMERLA